MNASAPLTLLTRTRDARREAAIVQLAQAQQQADLACVSAEQAHHALQASVQWRTELLTRCTLGQGQTLRESVLPGCEALLELQHQHWQQAQAALLAAQAQLQTQREHLAACERDSLRLQEWQQLQTTQNRRDLARLEDQQDDELVRSGRHSGARP